MVSMVINGKRAIAIGQVFIFIVTAITFALIMIFGYQAITDFLRKGEQVQFYQFTQDLETSFQRIYSEYGAVRIEQFFVPGDYNQICLVDMDDHLSDVNALCAHDPIACEVWQEARVGRAGREGGVVKGSLAVDENVFLSPPAPVKLKVPRLTADNGFVCLPILDGEFELRLEGQGDKAHISS